MRAKFEEKTFESYFNNELDRRSIVYFPFGQVQEGGIGADAASNSNDPWLWARLGFLKKFSGVKLSDFAAEMEAYLGQRIANIPAITANLLLQYKRPEYITTANGAEWSHWSQKYFRYNIYSEQHELLAHLDGKFKDSALIVYASPALKNVDELIDAKLQGNIIEKTNFRPARELTGHHRNTYVKSGTHSIACSEPETLENFDLLNRLSSLRPVAIDSNIEVVTTFADGVRGAIYDSPTLRNAFGKLHSELLEEGMEDFPILYSLLVMSIFRDLTGTQWIIALDGSSTNDTEPGSSEATQGAVLAPGSRTS